MREEDLYELATDELNSRNRKADLWARACALATDDVDEARYLYTNLRVEELAIEHDIDLTQGGQEPPQALSQLQLSAVETSDDTASLSPEHAETLSQRIPDSNDESNLTPAQLALKRVSESMGEAGSPLAMELSQSDDASIESKVAAANTDSTELSIDDSFLSQPTSSSTDNQDINKESDAKGTEFTESKSGSAGMVLGDLTSDYGDEADNTIHIDAESSHGIVEVEENNDIQGSVDFPESKSDEGHEAGDQAPPRSIADESLAALMDTFKPEQASPVDNPGIANGASDADSQPDAAASHNALNLAPDEHESKSDGDALPEVARATLENDEKISPTNTTSDDESDEDLHNLIGHGRESDDGSSEVATEVSSLELSDESYEEESAEIAFDANNADSIAAMQNAGPKLARDFAIYQNDAGIVSAVPKGGNLKAMFFTLPWLLSRRLWGHSIVYLLLLFVLLAALLTTASLVYQQWPNVGTVDLAVTGFFALLALIGLFFLPYKFANQWQEQKIAKQGFEYKRDQAASTLAGAEQSFLLGSKNRMEAIETGHDYAQAA